MKFINVFESKGLELFVFRQSPDLYKDIIVDGLNIVELIKQVIVIKKLKNWTKKENVTIVNYVIINDILITSFSVFEWN